MNDMSPFDPSTFLDATITEANTRRPPLPTGRDYIGVIGEPVFRTNKGVKDPTQTYHFLDMPITIDLTAAPDVQEALGGLAQVTLRYSIGLDLNPSGSLDNSVGKNNGLRIVREALGMNVAGQHFSLRAMQGRQIRVKVEHKPYQGDVIDQIASVAKV